MARAETSERHSSVWSHNKYIGHWHKQKQVSVDHIMNERDRVKIEIQLILRNKCREERNSRDQDRGSEMG